ncbi:MAG: STAS domain-containing protein [Deltaproteobacteria bacterium]|nr:STAS domain-containing protein [Deltaproteobacteria bacterium]NIS76377.1 STAS domain-containing protein [Deltaproteobacteria bacterium]
MARKLELETSEKGDVTVLYVNGYLNSLVGETLEDSVNGSVSNGRLKLVINFGKTKMINSVGISIVIGIVEAIAEKGGILAFTNLSRINRELFDITGVSDLVKIFKTEEDALAAISAVT